MEFKTFLIFVKISKDGSLGYVAQYNSYGTDRENWIDVSSFLIMGSHDSDGLFDELEVSNLKDVQFEDGVYKLYFVKEYVDSNTNAVIYKDFVVFEIDKENRLLGFDYHRKDCEISSGGLGALGLVVSVKPYVHTRYIYGLADKGASERAINMMEEYKVAHPES